MGRNEKKTPSLKRPRLEIVFDPDARKEHLTGFHKRKQERRRFGLAMQQIKDRKERLEERKERRAVEHDKLADLGLDERDLSEFNIREKRRREAAPDPEREVEQTAYADDATKAMFGGDVTVTTTFGIADSDDEAGDALDEELREHKRLKQGRRLENEQGRWSLAAVTKRVAAKMPRKKKTSSSNTGGTGKGSEKRKGGAATAAAGGKELMARAKGGMGRKALKAKDSKGKGRKGK